MFVPLGNLDSIEGAIQEGKSTFWQRYLVRHNFKQTGDGMKELDHCAAGCIRWNFDSAVNMLMKVVGTNCHELRSLDEELVYDLHC